MLGSVHDIVVSLCDQDRADAVAAVTASLLTQGEVVVVTRITNALIASGYSNHAATITGTSLCLLLNSMLSAYFWHYYHALGYPLSWKASELVFIVP